MTIQPPDVIKGSERVSDPFSPLFALVNFYRAFNQRDMALMEANWLSASTASMSNPLGGVKRGWPSIRTVYQYIFEGPARVYVEFYDYTIHQAGDLFCTVGRERGYFRIGDDEISLAIRTSRIYQRVGKEWKQLHHHGSMDDPDCLKSYQAAVVRG